MFRTHKYLYLNIVPQNSPVHQHLGQRYQYPSIQKDQQSQIIIQQQSADPAAK